MRSLSLLACLFFSFQIFSQTSVFFAKPVSLTSSEATEDIAYGQALSVDMEAWLDNTLDRIMVEHMEESRSMKKDDLLPFSPPAENMSLFQYAMEVRDLEFQFESRVGKDWEESKVLTFPNALSEGQSLNLLKSLYPSAFSDMFSLPEESMNIQNYNFGQIYMIDVLKMGTYAHYVFYLNSSGKWMHNVQLILDDDNNSKIIRSRYMLASEKNKEGEKDLYVIKEGAPFYSNSPVCKMSEGLMAANTRVYCLSEWNLTDAESMLDVRNEEGKELRMRSYELSSIPVPVNEGSIRDYMSMLHDLGYQLNYESKEWVQDGNMVSFEEFVLPTNNFSSAILLMERIYPRIGEMVEIASDGTLLKLSEDVRLSLMESGKLLQVSFRNILNENESLGLMLDQSGMIKVYCQRI